jgi:hypothetical protein
MSQPGYFSCEGCGRVFSLYNEGIAEYSAHDCDTDDDEDNTDA